MGSFFHLRLTWFESKLWQRGDDTSGANALMHSPYLPFSPRLTLPAWECAEPEAVWQGLAACSVTESIRPNLICWRGGAVTRHITWGSPFKTNSMGEKIPPSRTSLFEWEMTHREWGFCWKSLFTLRFNTYWLRQQLYASIRPGGRETLCVMWWISLDN